MKEPSTTEFSDWSLSLIASTEDLGFIFQQISRPECAVTLAPQWFQYENVSLYVIQPKSGHQTGRSRPPFQPDSFRNQEEEKKEILKLICTRRREGVIVANVYTTKSWLRAWIFKLLQISLRCALITFAKISRGMCSLLSVWFTRDVCVGSWPKAN